MFPDEEVGPTQELRTVGGQVEPRQSLAAALGVTQADKLTAPRPVNQQARHDDTIIELRARID